MTPEQKLERVARAFRLYLICMERAEPFSREEDYWRTERADLRHIDRAETLRAYIMRLTVPGNKED